MSIVNKLYERTTGDELFKINEESREIFVEGILSRGDYIMLVAQAKIGKTIFMQQLTACMTSGKHFLGVYSIPKPLKIWYFATEGRIDDLKERWIRVNNKNVLDKDKLVLFKTFFKFNSPEGIVCLKEIITSSKDAYPDVIIIDALYSGFKGSLKDDESANSFNDIMAQLIDKLNCSVILVHHLKKPGKDEKGNEIRQGGQDSYGSTFFDANLDHKFHLEKWRGRDYPMDRVLKCKLQRSGKIIDNVRIRLHEPDPLYFEMVSSHVEGKNKTLKILQTSSNGVDMDDLISRTRIGRSTLYTIVKELQDDNFIEKQMVDRTVKYTLIGRPC